MARPRLTSVAIFNFLSHWNQFLLPQVLLQGDESKWMLAQGLFALSVRQGYAATPHAVDDSDGNGIVRQATQV
ncbi:hypothetical protein [Micromonospora ureilytica]|uniref:hypothetical protein n=1 Tax=Micromonospora ureilytica TaxID=709868 RepID=UPI002E15E3A3|nr:hypothetical protein OHB55_07435 [Micromonospora ureilytica]